MSERVRIRWEGFVGELKARETFEVLLSDVTRFVLIREFAFLSPRISHQPSSFGLGNLGVSALLTSTCSLPDTRWYNVCPAPVG